MSMFTLEDEKEKNPGEEIGSNSRRSSSSRFLALIVAAGLLIGTFVKLFAFEFLHVSGRSMMPAIQNGETIFVNKLKFGIAKPFSDNLLLQWGKPQRGDVVIYLYDNKIVVKRCVCIGGDKIRCEREPDGSGGEDYFLFAGEKKINLTSSQYANMKFIRQVPDGYVMAIGDNYDESLDSRSYGFIPVKNILGKVLCK